MSRWFELDKRQKRYIHSKQNSWIFVNLLKYRNCLIPNAIVTRYGRDELEKYLSYILEDAIIIEEFNFDYIGITYIAKYLDDVDEDART